MKSVALTTSFLLTILFTSASFASNWMHYNQSNSPLPSNHVTAILSDDEGTWVGTDDGLAFFDGINWTIYDSETSELPDNYIRDIHKDNTGIIWVATDMGILKIGQTTWESFTTDNSSIPSDNVRSITTDSEGNVWIGTWGQGIATKNGNNWTLYDANNSDLPSNGIFTVEVDELGVIWAGTFNGGVTKFNGVTWTTYNTSNSELPHNHVRTIAFDQNHIAWFGTDDGVARKTPGGHWDIHTAETIGYSFHTVFEGVVESPGVVFFATDGGILQLESSSFSMITAQNSNLPSNNIRSLAIDPDGNLLVGTGNDGLTIYSPQGTLSTKDPIKDGNGLTVYPNPTSNQLEFLLPLKGANKTTITVTNGVGQTVLSKNVASTSTLQHQLDVGYLPAGTYYLTLQSSEGIQQSKFLKL